MKQNFLFENKTFSYEQRKLFYMKQKFLFGNRSEVLAMTTAGVSGSNFVREVVALVSLFYK